MPASAQQENAGDNVVEVKKHSEKPMAFVSLQSAEMAQAVVANPPDSVGGVPVMRVKPDQSDPNQVVLHWMGSHADLNESLIESEFNKLAASVAHEITAEVKDD